MITHQGSILEATSGIIIQQVNAQGVMGSGVAKVLRDAYPQIWDDYKAYFDIDEDERIHLMGTVIWSHVTPDLLVANIVGQLNYGSTGMRYTSYDALDEGLAVVAYYVANQNIEVSHPMIGAGLGGGSWSIISAIIEHHLGPNTHLYIPK